MNPLQIALVQMRCEKGAIDANLAAIEAALAAAARRGAEVACFPEMSITGYINPAERPRAVCRADARPRPDRDRWHGRGQPRRQAVYHTAGGAAAS